MPTGLQPIRIAFLLLTAGSATLGGEKSVLRHQQQDWPQFRGISRTNQSPMASLAIDWSQQLQPHKVWRYDDAGSGYGGPAIVGNRLWIMALREGMEGVLCLDASSGEELWWTPLGSPHLVRCCCLVGPRSTPTVDGDRVFSLTSGGLLACLSTETGQVAWDKDLTEHRGEIPDFGYAESVIVEGDRVLCTPGGKTGGVMALDVKTGDAIWQLAEPAGATRYTSIMPLAGGAESENRYVQIRGDKVALFNDDGKLKDTHDWRWGNSWQATSAFPLEHGAFYLIGNSGSERCEVINDEIVPVYNEPRVSTYHQGAVLVEEQVFISKSRLLRQDLATGDLLDVSRQEQMNGPILAGDGVVLVLDAAKRDRSAQVTLFRASDSSDRKSFFIEGRSKYFDGSRYNGMVTHPVVANGHLYIRDQELLLCFRFLTNETP